MSFISQLFSLFKLSSARMNFLKNRYPFKLLSFFRTSVRSPVELQRNKSDSALDKKPSQEALQLKSVETRESCSSLLFGKTSSEHSLDGRPGDCSWRKQQQKLDRELRDKLERLQSSLGRPKEPQADQGRLRLKRAYPWQNFNLSTVPPAELDFPKRQARSGNFLKPEASPSEQSLSSNSSHSLGGRGSLEDFKAQLPLFKSILKKSEFKPRPVKAVTFNNLATIYCPKAPTRDAEEVEAAACLGRFQPLKEEHSFSHLFTGKKQKTS
ncbi:hypothetical protein D910_12336 [Dendroctonus ponderosae]|uniref:Uncharacterized protein n=1 Tax=Dendroctonus ponderosae TaxID=77166 RepID=U4UXJ2_DENPD|nr:hypothetical protein D910_12336 [Dendroctonus ponderosae]